MNVSKYQRSIFAQFRCGILPLEIETGRFKDIMLNERICKLCESGCVEDEIHFLCECPNYSKERSVMYSKIYENDVVFDEMDSLDKFVYLMSNNERAVISFLSIAAERRRKSLYCVNSSN